MIGKISELILQFVVSLATARYLGPSNFGIINYVAAYVSFFSSIASLGLTVIVIKEISSNNYNHNEIVWTAIGMRIIAGILSTIGVISLIYITHSNDSTMHIIAFLESISILFSSFEVFNYYFQAKLLAKWVSIANFFGYIGMSLYRIYLLLTGKDIVWFAFATSLDTILLVIFSFVFYTRQEGFKPHFNKELSKTMFKQSYHYMIAGLMIIMYSRIDQVMIGSMLNQAAVGYYSATLKISGLFSLISSALIHSLSPILYEEARRDRQSFLRRLKQSYSIIFWLNAIFSIIVSIFAKWIIVLLYGNEFIAGISALRIVVWYYGISEMASLNQIYLANDNKNKYINKFCFAGVVIDIVLNMMLIPKYGINGAAIATLITQVIVQIIMPYLYKDTREISRCIFDGIILKNVINQSERKFIKKLIKHKMT